MELEISRRLKNKWSVIIIITFDNYIVLNYFPSSYKSIKMFKTSMGLTKLSFKASSFVEDDRELPKFMNLLVQHVTFRVCLKVY